MAEKPTSESYETLVKAYEYFNQALFNGQLPDVIITFHRQQKVMGYASIGRWVNNARQYIDELAVNPEYFAKFPLSEICQTLCHEMTHIWQAHSGNPGRRGYHNAEWARKMSQIGLIPSSNGKPGGKKTGEWMMDYVLFDGPFHTACRELLISGYSIPWVDRYPVFRLELPIFAYDDLGNAFELTPQLRVKAKSTTIAARRTEQEVTKASKLNSNAMTGIHDERTSYEMDFEEDNLSELITSRPRSRSGRIKYSCKSCHIQLWGRPGLHVVCGDCNVKLVEII